MELVAAETWGVPPWVVEEGPAVWMDRWVALLEARASAKPKEIPVNRLGSRGLR